MYCLQDHLDLLVHPDLEANQAHLDRVVQVEREGLVDPLDLLAHLDLLDQGANQEVWDQLDLQVHLALAVNQVLEENQEALVALVVTVLLVQLGQEERLDLLDLLDLLVQEVKQEAKDHLDPQGLLALEVSLFQT